MKNLKTAFYLFSFVCLTSLTACSSTQPTANTSAYNDNFSHTQFKATSGETIKKSLDSDHQLMMALLNRPMTDDQKMMLAFAKEREQQAQALGNEYAAYISIKGEKDASSDPSFDSVSDRSFNRPTSIYSELISNDINAVEIMGAL